MFKRLSNCVRLAVCSMALSWPSVGVCQYPAPPDTYAPKAFSAEAKERLCGGDGVVGAKALLGELSAVGAINVLALPPPPSIAGGEVNDAPEAWFAAWLVASDEIYSHEAQELKLSKEYHRKLVDIRNELVDYLIRLQSDPTSKPYRLAPNASLGSEPSRNHGRVMESLFASALGGTRVGRIEVLCVQNEQAAGAGSAPLPPKTIAASASVFAVRGKIDDLAVPRADEAFGKASEAKMGFVRNGVKGEETVNGEFALSAGWQLTPHDALLGFVHYVHSTTETDAIDDEDDSKNVRAISPGILYRRSVGSSDGGPIYATAGATLYPTYDMAQDSRLFRGRVFLSDIAIRRPAGPPLCGVDGNFDRKVFFSCRLGVFAELGRVLEAGRSIDLAEDEDDEYAGAGFNTSFSFWLAKPQVLAPFTLNLDYRWMKVFSGELPDPSRFSIEVAYKIPKSNISIGLSRSYGENFETFQLEEMNKLSIGFKY